MKFIHSQMNDDLPITYDVWRLAYPEEWDNEAPSCPLCGGEMIEEDDEFICPDCEGEE